MKSLVKKLAVAAFAVLTFQVTASAQTNLALNKPVTSDPAQVGNEAAKGNDGSGTTRFAAADGAFPKLWRVDLGTSQTITQVEVDWLNPTDRAYKYIIETSTDDVTFTPRVDKSNNTVFGNTSDTFAAVTARYVRIKITGATGGFASFYEMRVFNGGGGGTAAVITSPLTSAATVGTAYSYTITTTGTAPITYGAAGLPSWLTRSGNVLSGTPTNTTGSPFTINLTASNAYGSDAENLVLTVSPTAPAGNLALGKPASAYTASTPATGNIAAKAFDGVANTRWQATAQGVSTADTGWIQVDLGQSYNLGKVVLKWESAYGKDYKIQVSNTGAAGTWTTVPGGDRTNMPGTVTQGTPNMIIHSLPIGGATGVSGRYVRMQGVTRSGGYGYSLYEFEVYAFVPPPNQTGNQTIKLNFPVQNYSYGKVTVSPTPLSISPAPDLANGSNANGSVIVVQNPTTPQTYSLTFPPNTDVTLTKTNFSGPIPGSTGGLQTVDYKGDTLSGDSITTRAFANAGWNFLVTLPPANPNNPPANWIPDPYLSAAPTPVPAAGSFGVSAPGDNAMITNTRKPAFSWAAASGATSYDLYINTSRTDYDWNAKGSLLDRFTKVNASPITGTSYTLTEDLPDRWTYRWYIKANNGARSNMRTFSLYLPVLETIADGVNIVNGSRDMNKNGTIEPYEDWHNTPAVRAADLLGRLDAKQKSYQLFFNTQLYPQAGFGFGPFAPADGLAYQKAAAATAFGIPYICLGDNIHGFKTVHPTQPGLTAGRDQQTAWEVADMQRREEVAVGYRGTLSPLSEVGTKVLYPRIQEGCGEDADYAAGQVRAMVTGLQGGPELNPKSLLITVKHWPSQGGGGEAGVTYDGTTIWYHMRPWHGAIEAGAACVMPGYSGSWLLNTQGRGAGDDAGILGFLRATAPANGMGFQNLIMTDWLPSGAWIRACNAGSDIMGGADPGAVLDPADGGGIAIDRFSTTVPIARIDDACRRVLETKFKMGVFEDPYGANVNGTGAWHTPENEAIAYNAAAQSLTLLKNDGALPIRLPAGKNIVIDGPRADDPSCMVTWRSDFHETDFGCKTIYKAIKERATAEGLNVYAPHARTPIAVPNGTTIDAAIVVVGESYYTHGTFWVKENPYLPDDTTNGQVAHDAADGPQYGLIQQYRAAGIPTTVICLLPRPYVLTSVSSLTNALMVVYRPGDLGGPAVANLLFGDYLPQGKLPWQLPRQMSQIGDDVQANWQLQPDRWDLPYDMGIDTQGAADIKAVIAAGGSFPDLTTTGNPLYQHGFGIQGFGLTDGSAPAAFNTVTPTGGQAITGTMPNLSWSASSDAQTGIQRYEVYLDGAKIYTTRKGLSVKLSDIGVSIAPGSHTWYVKAFNWANGSTNTATASFSISDATVPAAFAALFPAAGGTAPAGATATFYWEQSSDAGTGIAKYIMKLDGADQSQTLPTTPVSSTVNLALNKDASASATGYGTPRNANDGDGTGGSRWASPNGDQTATLQIDLGAVYSVKQIVLNFQNNAASGYKLQVSVDGTTWTTLKTITGQTGTGVFTHNAGNGLAAGAGRYVRFQGVTQSGAYGFSIYEFEVYGLGTESKTIPVSAGAHTWAVRAIDGANNTTNNSNGTLSFTKQ